MRFLQKTFFFVLTCGLSSPVFADAIGELRQFLNATQTWQAEFEQVQPAPPDPNQRIKIRRLDTREGKVYMAKPNKLRWETEGKGARLVVSDGEVLWNFDADLKQVVRQKLNNTPEATPSSIFSGAGKLDEQFELENESRADGLPGVKLTPKEENSPFFEIHLGLEKGAPKALEFSDQYGFESRITFYKSKLNRKLDEKLFRYTPPKNVEVVNLDEESQE